jgi:metal-sulfur cluster biosynthetic enzyme
MDQEVLDSLRSVLDPELGLNVVDLGLVYEAERSGGKIHIALTMTTPACPLGDMMVHEIKDVLAARFPNVADVSVDLVWDPPWSPEKMTNQARQQLGLEMMSAGRGS